jgi:putative copper export protein
MSEPVAPGEDVFTEADLAPSAHELQLARRHLGDRVATALAVTCCGAWAGGLLALGACAAPMVFRLTPYPHSGNAMSAAFARFDTVAVGLSVGLLGCEVARTLLSLHRKQLLAVRVRRYLSILAALGAVFTATRLTPAIQALHRGGARRGFGEAGARFEVLHTQAEMIGKVTVLLAVVLIFLHVFTLSTGGNEAPDPDKDDEQDEVRAPLPPGGALPD